MKKAKYIALSSVALLLASCASDDVLSTSQEDANAIVFNAVSDVSDIMRGVKVEESEFTSNGFSVYANAMKNGQPTPIMEDTKVSTNDGGTTWNYAPIVYWPNDGSTVDFYGIYQQNFDNRNVLLSYGYDKRPKITYIVPQTIDDHKDILWAPPVLNATSTTSPVTFNFQHILTAVSMQVTDNLGDLVTALAATSDDNFHKKSLYDAGGNYWGERDLLESEIINFKVESIELSGDFPTHGIINPLETDPTKVWNMYYDETARGGRTYTLRSDRDNFDVTDTSSNPTVKVTQNKDDATLFLLPSGETTVTIKVNYSFSLYRDMGNSPVISGNYKFSSTQTKKIDFEVGKELKLNMSQPTTDPYTNSMSSLVKL